MCVPVQSGKDGVAMLETVRATVCAPTLINYFYKETTMKITLLAALLAVAGLTACEKTTVNPPPTVITPTVETPAAAPAAVPVPVPVPGPAGPAGPEGEKGEPGKDGDTVLVVPETPAEPAQ